MKLKVELTLLSNPPSLCYLLALPPKNPPRFNLPNRQHFLTSNIYQLLNATAWGDHYLGDALVILFWKWCNIGNFLEAFGIIKNTELICYRHEEKLIQRLALGENYFEIISMLLAAVPTFIENTLGSNLISITFIENLEKQNPRLFELPSSPQMTPLGFGTAFRLASIPPAPDLLSFSIERVLLKNDDVLFPGDESLRILLGAFHKENTPALSNFHGNVTDLIAGTRRGRFNELYLKAIKEERRGISKYMCVPLMVYGRCTREDGPEMDFDGQLYGYDLKPHFFEDTFPKECSRQTLFDVIELLKNIKQGLYAKLDAPSSANISLLSFMRERKTFLLMEFSPPRQDANGGTDPNFMGFLLQLNPIKTGHNLAKILYKTIFCLKESYAKFLQNDAVSYIDAFIGKEFTALA